MNSMEINSFRRLNFVRIVNEFDDEVAEKQHSSNDLSEIWIMSNYFDK
jgi:hypothetical protein